MKTTIHAIQAGLGAIGSVDDVMNSGMKIYAE